MGKKKRLRKAAQRAAQASTPSGRAAPVRKAPRIPLSVVAALAIALVAAALVAFGLRSRESAQPASPSPPSSTASANPNAALGPGVHFPSQGHSHDLSVEQLNRYAYNSNPPTSGPHIEVFPQNFVNSEPLPKYMQVHVVEHGSVLLQYNCTCPDVVAALADVAEKYDARLLPGGMLSATPEDVRGALERGVAVIVAPNHDMKSKIALTAWTRLESLDRADRQTIGSFINAYLSNMTNAAQ